MWWYNSGEFRINFYRRKFESCVIKIQCIMGLQDLLSLLVKNRDCDTCMAVQKIETGTPV